MTADGYTIRRATAADIPTLARHRRAMFADLGGHGTPGQLDAVEARFPGWVEPRMATGAWRHWLAELDVDAVAGAALWLREAPPGNGEHPDIVPTVLNVYVEPDHRSRGLARRLMDEIVAVCRHEMLVPFVDLHASEMGRPLYLSMGFQPTAELRLSLESR